MSLPDYWYPLSISLSFFRLISVKVLNSIFLLGKACKYVAEEEEREQERRQAELSTSISSQSAQTLGTSSTASFMFDRKAFFDSKIAKKPKNEDGKGGDDSKRKRAKTLAEIDRFTLVTNQIA